MRDYTRGTLEALCWIEALIQTLKDSDDPAVGWVSLTTEIRGAIEDIKKGIAVDFRARLRATN